MRIRLVTAIVLSALLLVACGQPTPLRVRFEPNGAPLTGISAEKLAASTDIGPVAAVAVDKAPAVRAEMLKQLRADGPAGERAAQLLTTGFPTATASVPILVRDCSFEGTSAVIVVEAFGDATGKLTHRRLWVFGAASGDVMRAASFR